MLELFVKHHHCLAVMFTFHLALQLLLEGVDCLDCVIDQVSISGQETEIVGLRLLGDLFHYRSLQLLVLVEDLLVDLRGVDDVLCHLKQMLAGLCLCVFAHCVIGGWIKISGFEFKCLGLSLYKLRTIIVVVILFFDTHFDKLRKMLCRFVDE